MQDTRDTAATEMQALAKTDTGPTCADFMICSRLVLYWALSQTSGLLCSWGFPLKPPLVSQLCKICCCVKKIAPKLSGIKQAMLIVLQFLWSRIWHGLTGPLLWGLSETAVKVSVACSHLKAHLGKALFPSSCTCWQDSALLGLLDWGPQFPGDSWPQAS